MCLKCGAEKSFKGSFFEVGVTGTAFASKREQMITAVKVRHQTKRSKPELTKSQYWNSKERRPFGYWETFAVDIMLDIRLYGQREARYQWDIPQGTWGSLNNKWALGLPKLVRRHRQEACLTPNAMVLNGSSPTPGISESPGEGGCSRSPGDTRIKKER